MPKTYNVHYPNGDIKKHQLAYDGICVASLDRVFYNYSHFFQIAEMNDEDIWVESLDKQEYLNRVKGPLVFKNYVFFDKDFQGALIEY